MTKTSLLASICVLSLSASPGLLAGNYGGSDGVHGVAEREISRRQETVTRVESLIDAGDKAMAERDFEEAVRQYRGAVDACPESENTHKLRSTALSKFCDATIKLAEQRVAEGRYKDAENLCNLILRQEYAPGCKDAVRMLARLEDPEYYNHAITPKHVENVEEVKRLLTQAENNYTLGRYDRAMNDYDKVLNIDPYNIAARKGQERVSLAKDQYAIPAYNESRGRLLYQLDSAWQSPVRKFRTGPDKNQVESQTDLRRTAVIEKKLSEIIIPKIDLTDATVREAVTFLKQKSVALDLKEQDPTKRGVNIVLKLDSASGGGAPSMAPVPATSTEPAIPGLESAAPVAPAASSGPIISPSDVRITIALTNVPLGEVLKYIAGQANLKVKIDPYAVSIVPISEPTDVLITKEYKVPPTFMNSTASAPAAGNSLSGGSSTGGLGAAASVPKRAPAREVLEQNGVLFPPGASAQYFPSSSRLVVRNTQENLDLIDILVTAVIGNIAPQVEIESKFVEVTQQNLKELSFDWLLGQFNIPGSNRVFGGGGTPGNNPTINSSDYPFVPPGSTNPVGQYPLTAANRSGDLAISANAIDALLFGVAGNSAKAASVFGVAGVFTDPQFQLVIRAINQKKGVDLLSAPRVTTKSGGHAVIEIVRDFIYPKTFQAPEIPQSFGGGGSSNAVGNQTISVFPVTPTTPTDFETKKTGVTLTVDPVVSADNYTIDLTLTPEVIEFEGFINYGSPIKTVNPAASGILGGVGQAVGVPASVTLTDNVINQPIFSRRSVSTAVSIWDGSTVVLGGLMREDVQKVQDKVPLLGDIPIAGRLFRSDVDQHLKRNLVIFVTAHLIKPDGELVQQTEEEDETPKELPLPEGAAPAPMPENGFAK